MSKEQEVKDIIKQLQRLQVQQANLITKLERLSTIGDKATATNTALRTVREFAIGDRVRIKNPRVLQPQKGKILKIGTDRITIQSILGTKIV
jgi:hypothetical protein